MPGLHLEEAWHHRNRRRAFRHEEFELSFKPFGPVLLRVGGLRMPDAAHFLAVRAEKFCNDPRVKPRFLALDESGDLLAPREAQRLRAFGDVGHKVFAEHFAWLGLFEDDRAISGEEAAGLFKTGRALGAALREFGLRLGGRFCRAFLRGRTQIVRVGWFK